MEILAAAQSSQNVLGHWYPLIIAICVILVFLLWLFRR